MMAIDQSLLHRDLQDFYNRGLAYTLNLYNQLIAPLTNLFNSVLSNPVNLSAITEPTQILKDVKNDGTITYSISGDNFLNNINWGDWQRAMILKWFFKYGNPFTQGYRDVASAQTYLSDAFLTRPTSAIRDYQTSYINPSLMKDFVKTLYSSYQQSPQLQFSNKPLSAINKTRFANEIKQGFEQLHNFFTNKL